MFLCLATRSVHRELLTSMGLAFLLALGRWIGKPKGSLSERGTNFCGAEMELPETLHAPVRQGKFNQSQLSFKFNAQIPLIFGGVWEIEKRSVIIEVWSHSVSKEVLATALIEVADILNSKPWGHTFFSVAYWDAIPPNKLQMGGAQCFFTSSCLCARLMVWHRRRQSQILSVQFLTKFVSVVSSHTNCTITTEMGIAFRESHSEAAIGFFLLPNWRLATEGSSLSELTLKYLSGCHDKCRSNSVNTSKNNFSASFLVSFIHSLR